MGFWGRLVVLTVAAGQAREPMPAPDVEVQAVRR